MPGEHRSEKSLSESSRALARGLSLGKVPLGTRKELNKLRRVINKTVKRNVGKEGVLVLAAPPPKWLAHTQQCRAHAGTKLLSEPKFQDQKAAGGSKRAAAEREGTGDAADYRPGGGELGGRACLKDEARKRHPKTMRTRATMSSRNPK